MSIQHVSSPIVIPPLVTITIPQENSESLQDFQLQRRSQMQKLVKTALFLSSVDLAASYFNSLPEVDNNTFGKLKSSSTGLALLSSLVQANVIGEVIYGPWENMHSKTAQLAVTGSHAAVATLFDLIISQKPGMSSTIGVQVVCNLLYRNLSCDLYNKYTYKRPHTVAEVCSQEEQELRYAVNASALFAFDIIGATCVRVISNDFQLGAFASFFYGPISNRFTVQLFAELDQGRKKAYRVLVPIGRLFSMALSHYITACTLGGANFQGFLNPITATGLGITHLLACRMFLSHLYPPSSSTEQKKNALIYTPGTASNAQLTVNTGLLLVNNVVAAVANRFFISPSAALLSNIAHAVGNLQLTRSLFENVAPGLKQTLVIGGQLAAAFVIEQSINALVPGTGQAVSGLSAYVGRITSIALSTACTFASTMFVNKIWRL